MDLLLQLQQDVCDKLNSEAALQTVWIGTYRSMVTSQEIEKRMPHLMGRTNGETTTAGLGVLIMMPVDRGIFPNVAPPMSEDHLTIWVVECPEINEAPGGCAPLICETVSRMIRRMLHQLGIEGLTMLYQDEMAIVPLAGIEKLYPGCCGYQVALKGRVPDTAVQKCVLPALTDDGAGNVTLATTDSGASIYFTVDGSFPGPGNATAGVVAPGGRRSGGWFLYTAPFAVAAGTVVRWASFKAGCYGSDAGEAAITIP